MTRPAALDPSLNTLPISPVSAKALAPQVPLGEKIPDSASEMNQVPASGMMTVAFELYKLAVLLGLSISKNERTSTEESKKMYKHWNKVGVDDVKGQGTSGLGIALVSLAIPVIGDVGNALAQLPEAARKQNNELFQKISSVTPQLLGMWTYGHTAGAQEAQGKASLLQTDLQNGPQTMSQYRSNVEESSKNLAQNIFQLVASAAKNGG